MEETELRLSRVVFVAAGTVLLLAVVVTCAFALLHHWQLPPGGEGGSSGLVAPIPEPRLQTAPQLDRAAASQPVGMNSAPEIEQRLGASLPAGLSLRDAMGQPAQVLSLQEDRPTVLLPAYYRCDTLCGTVAHGALEALADTGLPPSAWRLVLFSIDPADTPADARALRAVYAQYAAWSRESVYAHAPPDMRLLTGDARSTRALARSIGFRWVDEGGATPSYAHPTGLVVLTPHGVVSRYLLGVRFEPRRLRAALVEASGGRVGTLADRLLLACSHLDPRDGKHNAAVIALLRIVGLGVLAALGTWMWRHRASRGGTR